MKLFKENKGIMISGCLLVLLAVCFTSLISYRYSYNGDISLMTGYFGRVIIRLCLSVGAFILAYKYGKKVMPKYGWLFIPIGIAVALFSNDGYIYLFDYGIDIAPLTNTLAVLGLALYFYKHSVKSVLHTILFWISGFLFLLAAEKGYFVITLMVMVGFMLVSTYKNKLIGEKAIWILNLVLYAVLFAWTVKIMVTGIIKLTNLFYDTGYMAAVARNVFANIKWFGAGIEPQRIGGAVSDYKLLWIFGLFGIVAGVVVFATLSAFTFFVCKKCFKNVLTDTTPIAFATVSILLVKLIISMLTNFGIVLGGLFAPIPILSDGTCGYMAIFALLGLIVGKEKVDIHSKRFGFVGRLSNFTKREFVFDGVECRSIEGVLQSFKCKDITEQKRICMLSGINAKNAGAEIDWKKKQVLYWNNTEYQRESVEYDELLKRLYEAAYECDSSSKNDIEDSKKYILDHSIGVEDKTETVLTKDEFISKLTMLQKLRNKNEGFK